MPHMPSCLDILTKLWKNLPTKNCSNYLLNLYISTFCEKFLVSYSSKNIKIVFQMWVLNFLASAEFDWSRGTWSRFYIKQKLNWGGAAEPLDSHHIYSVQYTRKSGALAYHKKCKTVKMAIDNFLIDPEALVPQFTVDLIIWDLFRDKV